MSDTLKYGSYHVNGLQTKMKRKKVFTLLKEHNLDIVMIQESHCTKDIEHLWKAEWGGGVFATHGTSESKGVMKLF